MTPQSAGLMTAGIKCKMLPPIQKCALAVGHVPLILEPTLSLIIPREKGLEALW
jgi:hypothetical protein